MMQKNLGEFLKTLRIEQHLTQKRVAEKLGITRQAYAYYENCNAIPDLTVLMELANLYDISFQTFLDYYPLENTTHIAEAAAYQTDSFNQNIYPEYLAFYSQHDNMKKYHYLNNSEKKLLFMFQKLSRQEQLELLQWTYFKSISHSGPDFLSESTR